MPKPRTLSINIPFEGFYDSRWSQELDHVESQECEHFAGDGQAEEGIAEELRLTESDYAEILLSHTTYGTAYDAIARAYVVAFNSELTAAFGFDTRLAFEAMTSPREYNFATDRLFCDCPLSVVRKLWDISKADNHATLAEELRKRFTSCDGFISHYSNRLEEWPSDWREWDHNQLGTLLRACMRLKLTGETRDDDIGWRIYYRLAESEVFHSAHSSAVDWPAFESAVKEKREEIAEELRESMGIELPAEATWTRCDKTRDLFEESN